MKQLTTTKITDSIKINEAKMEISEKILLLFNAAIRPLNLHYVNGMVLKFKEISDSLLDLSYDESYLKSVVKYENKYIMLLNGFELFSFKELDKESKEIILSKIEKTKGFLNLINISKSVGIDVQLEVFQDKKVSVSCLKVNLSKK